MLGPCLGAQVIQVPAGDEPQILVLTPDDYAVTVVIGKDGGAHVHGSQVSPIAVVHMLLQIATEMTEQIGRDSFGMHDHSDCDHLHPGEPDHG